MSRIFDILVSKFGSDLISLADANYLEEPRGRYKSNPMPVIKPRTTKQVSEIIYFCNQNNIGVIPYAGGTGLVGGQTIKSDKDTILLSVERMQSIRDILPEENIIIVEAGAILENVRQAANDIDRLFPLALASQGSCRIGGNLATNAGGVQVLRYGNTRDLCLGIEAVLPDGSILNGLKRLRKDNTGYDIRNLLIGSEGTLGIITAACLKLFPKPKETITGVLEISSPEIAIKTLSDLQAKLDSSITAFELIHKQSYNFLSEVCPDVKIPFNKHPEWSILIELSAGVGSNLESRLFEGIEELLIKGLINDALIAQSEKQAKEFWNLRENIPEANRRIGSISNHDISLPISLIPKFIDEMPDAMVHLGDLRINCFGHLGDGNLHCNFKVENEKEKDIKFLHKYIYELTLSLNGSIAAEHGLGQKKNMLIKKYKSKEYYNFLINFKKHLDPNKNLGVNKLFKS